MIFATGVVTIKNSHGYLPLELYGLMIVSFSYLILVLFPLHSQMSTFVASVI